MSNTYIYPDEELSSAKFTEPFFTLRFGSNSGFMLSLSKYFKLTPLSLKNQVLWAYEEWLRKEKEK